MAIHNALEILPLAGRAYDDLFVGHYYYKRARAPCCNTETALESTPNTPYTCDYAVDRVSARVENQQSLFCRRFITTFDLFTSRGMMLQTFVGCLGNRLVAVGRKPFPHIQGRIDIIRA
jgi:hypothetical protein